VTWGIVWAGGENELGSHQSEVAASKGGRKERQSEENLPKGEKS